MLISSFQNDYRFLSNFYKTPIYYEDITYPSSEHAYQALKTLDINERKFISSLPSPGEAKRYGKKIKIRENWDKIKFNIMSEIVKQKFLQNSELKRLLIETGDNQLIEGNNWGDTYWGVCNGKGQNCLGKILMNLRDEFNFKK